MWVVRLVVNADTGEIVQRVMSNPKMLDFTTSLITGPPAMSRAGAAGVIAGQGYEKTTGKPVEELFR